MEQFADASLITRYDRIYRLIQKRVADKIKLPIEIQLGGDRIYRLGKGEPKVRIQVKDRQGLAALSKLDEVRICEAYMAGSQDVAGDMLGFASLRGLLSDHHPLHTLWRRIAPFFVGRVSLANSYSYSDWRMKESIAM
jgi:cyclopropane-fatty-acyl-phospholipid synthase